MLDLNVKGVFHLTRYLVPALAAASQPGDPSRVINIGSIDGLHVPDLETYSYSTSKAAVHHLTKVLAKRLARDGITVNAIAPGPFESQMMAATLDAFRDGIIASCPLRRIGEPDDMAGTAIFLQLEGRRPTSPGRSSPSTAASPPPSRPVSVRADSGSPALPRRRHPAGLVGPTPDDELVTGPHDGVVRPARDEPRRGRCWPRRPS